MPQLTEIIENLEQEKGQELKQTLSIDGREAYVLNGESMADLFQQCLERNIEMITMPQIAKARVDADLNSEQGRLLWKYNWMTQSALSRLYTGTEDDLAAFTIGNIFPNEQKRISAYQRNLVSGGIPLNEGEFPIIWEGIGIKYTTISNSPRGVIPITGFLSHPVVLGAFGNNEQLVKDYAAKYVEVMKKSPFTPLEIGVWFSKDDAPNTMRPLEIGDSGIGIYNRSLYNKGYRTIGLKK